MKYLIILSLCSTILHATEESTETDVSYLQSRMQQEASPGENTYADFLPYVIVDLDPTPLTGPYLYMVLRSWGLSGVYTTNANVIDSLSNYIPALICLGIYPNNYTLTSAQANAIGTYLTAGHAAYLEGGDCWGYDASRTILCPLFGIDPILTNDGYNDLYTVAGQTNWQIPQVAGNTWSYTGENQWIDRLELYATPPNGGTVEGFLYNPTVFYWTGVAYTQGIWRTVGLSHELAGDEPGTVPTDSLVWWLAMYLPLLLGIADQPAINNAFSFGFAPRMSTIARDYVSITYITTVSGPVSLQVYDGVGRLLQTLVNEEQTAGEKSVCWNRVDMNGRTVANGVYFCRLEAENKTATHKLVIVD